MNFVDFFNTLPVFIFGWLGVFVVITIIYFVIMLLNKAFPGVKK